MRKPEDDRFLSFLWFLSVIENMMYVLGAFAFVFLMFYLFRS